MSGFNATLLDGSSPTPIPMSSAIVPGDKTPHPIQGTRSITDGQGNVLSDVAVSVLNANANGQNTMVNSSPVVLASNHTPVPTDRFYYLKNAQAYQVTTGHVAGPGVGNFPMSIFNASGSGKNILVYRIKFYTSVSGVGNRIYLTTTDPAYATTLTAANMKAGGAASVLTTSITTTNVSVSFPSGTQIDAFGGLANTPYELLTDNAAILLPQGSANGLDVVFVLSGAANYLATMDYLEY